MRTACPTAGWFPRCRLSGTQPWSRAPAVNDSEDLPRSGIDQGRHPRFDPPQPAGTAGPQRQLGSGLSERPTWARPLAEHQPRLHQDQLNTVGVRDVLEPLPAPRVHPLRHHPTVRTAIRDAVGLCDHTTTPRWQIDRIDHVMVRQVEDHARSITPRTRRLDHSS